MNELCRVCADPDRRALKFNLMRNMKQPNGAKTTRGCGATRLCEPCWRDLTRGFRRRGGSAPK